MSRFFARSDSESEESSSDDEITDKAPGATFKQSLLLSDDEEDTKRVVRSAKDKRFEELTNLIKTIRNAMKIRDMSKCLEEFEQLCRAFLKSKNIVDKEGIPPFYIRLLADLEDYLNQLWEDKEGKKKMNKNNAKALSTLRQKIRKYNRDFESEIAAYKEVKSKTKSSRLFSMHCMNLWGGGVNLGLIRSVLWSKDCECAEQLPSGVIKSESCRVNVLLPNTASVLRSQDTEKPGVRKDERKKKPKQKEQIEEEAEEEGGWEKVNRGVPLVKEKPKMFAKGTEINTAVVVKKLNEILQARGKKGTDRAAQIELFHALAAIAAENNLGQGILVKIKFNIIASLYDYNPNLAAFMKPDMWKKCLDCIDELLDILFEHNNIFIGENIAEDSENLAVSDQPFRVRGCILTLVERMDEEFTKIMQNTDPHSQGEKIQEESLRTYLFTYSSVYDSISMATLSEMFELEMPTVHSIISKMIINEELMASLDQPTQTVVMHRTEPTSLQNMALQLAEKLGNLVENNERVFDLKQGVYGGYFNRGKFILFSQYFGNLFLTFLNHFFVYFYQKSYQQKQSGYQRGGYRNQNQGNY
uniref:Eukaryotic translation initiation factor 3 subunit C-like n=1 Tax=Pundamilia nyererei TaxID=303518 RepID=A0A3B4GKW1_9CICH